MLSRASGDKVTCEHQGQWYEAKILKVDEAAERYLVHFTGWNTRYDCWVGEASLRAEEQRRPEEERRRKRPSEEEMPDAKRSKDERIKLPLPRELKEQLVADWEQITLEPRKWVPVPRRPCVRDLVGEFVEARARGEHQRRWREFGDALLTYFDKALPKILLYRYEREQFEELKRRYTPGTAVDVVAEPSKLFGAEHLLRLFAKLPELLVKTNLSPQELMHTKAKLADFFKFLVKNKARLFLETYELREALLGRMADDPADPRHAPLPDPLLPDSAVAAT